MRIRAILAVALSASAIALAADEPRTKTSLFELDAGASLVNVRVDDFVDVLHVRKKGAGSEAVTLLQHVKVVAVKPEHTIGLELTEIEVKQVRAALATGRLRVSVYSMWESWMGEEGAGPSAYEPLPMRPAR